MTVWLANKKREYRECDAWRQHALERIAAEAPSIVFLAGYHVYDLMDGDDRVPLADDRATWAEGLKRTIEAHPSHWCPGRPHRRHPAAGRGTGRMPRRPS
ncbi:MAG: hypothetical protein R3C32_02990 [Chloroflexota bacterium]